MDRQTAIKSQFWDLFREMWLWVAIAYEADVRDAQQTAINNLKWDMFCGMWSSVTTVYGVDVSYDSIGR